HPAPVPQRAGGDRGRAVGAVDQRPRATHVGDLEGGRAGLRAGGLPTASVGAVRVVLVPRLLPGMGRRSRAGQGASPTRPCVEPLTTVGGCGWSPPGCECVSVASMTV